MMIAKFCFNDIPHMLLNDSAGFTGFLRPSAPHGNMMRSWVAAIGRPPIMSFDPKPTITDFECYM